MSGEITSEGSSESLQCHHVARFLLVPVRLYLQCASVKVNLVISILCLRTEEFCAFDQNVIYALLRLSSIYGCEYEPCHKREIGAPEEVCHEDLISCYPVWPVSHLLLLEVSSVCQAIRKPGVG